MSNIILQNSSQPYLYLKNNQKHLLYCFADNTVNLFFGTQYSIRPWKIRCKNMETGEDFEVATPKQHSEHGNVILECNPHISTNNNNIYLNYIAGFNKGVNKAVRYFICSISFADLSFSGSPISDINILKNTFTGYVDNNFMLYNSQYKFDGKLIKEEFSTGTQTEIIVGLEQLVHVLRISKIYNQNYYLMTGQTNNNNFISILLDNNFNYIRHIRNQNNEDVYKCTILDNNLIYTVRDESDTNLIEKRYLVEESYTI